ncbi:hypothetical protein TUM4261_05870 [Shewanella sp. c952]|nr:hypothetical protein TUM4261_05870 [Shewanella sp. c952]
MGGLSQVKDSKLNLGINIHLVEALIVTNGHPLEQSMSLPVLVKSFRQSVNKEIR